MKKKILEILDKTRRRRKSKKNAKPSKVKHNEALFPCVYHLI